MSSTRREFLVAGVAAVATAPVSRTLAVVQARVPIIDTHLHCFAGKDPRFPFHANAPYRPTDKATPEHLLECMDGAGVDHAIVVHPEPYQDDHRYFEHCLRVGGKRLKGTCLFFADQPDSLARLPGLAKRHPGRIVAARIHALRKDRIPDFETPDIGRLWQRASDLGLAVQLHFESRYAGGFEKYIRQFPETTVIIDHLGRPLQGTAREHARVFRWARYPNTIIKIASLPAPGGKTPRPIGPIIQRLVTAYGPERSIYGGGFNGMATPASYRAYRERVRGFLMKFSDQDQAHVLGGTAARIFGFAG